MRIVSAHIQRFRCLHDVTVEFDNLTVMIGANGSGKSSMLHALNWFFGAVRWSQRTERLRTGCDCISERDFWTCRTLIWTPWVIWHRPRLRRSGGLGRRKTA